MKLRFDVTGAISFNPYFNGYSTLTENKKSILRKAIAGFNPYFNGYSTLTS